MKEFVIVTDTTTDLPREYVEKHHLYMMSLPYTCLLYTSPSPRDKRQSRMPSSA